MSRRAMKRLELTVSAIVPTGVLPSEFRAEILNEVSGPGVFLQVMDPRREDLFDVKVRVSAARRSYRGDVVLRMSDEEAEELSILVDYAVDSLDMTDADEDLLAMRAAWLRLQFRAKKVAGR